MVGGFSFYERAEIKDLLELSAPGAESARLDGVEPRHQHAGSRHRGRPRWQHSNGLRLKPGNPHGTSLKTAIEQKLISSRAGMALDPSASSFSTRRR